MSTERVLRFEVPSHQVLERLAMGPLPDGLRGGPVALDFYRELFLDTVGGDLERRGVTVRLCVRPDGTRMLTVDVRERATEEAHVIRTHAEAVIAEEDLQQFLGGDSEPARLLRALIDPARLGVRLELENVRRVREVFVEPQELKLRFVCDLLTARHGERAVDLQELEISLPPGEVPGLDAVVEALRTEFGLRVTLAGKLARARERLEQHELQVLTQGIYNARAVAVLALHDGSVALRRADDALRVPTGQGWGEDACRQVLRASFGRSQGQVRLLGTSAGVGTQPALEVWLAERVHHNGVEEAGGIEWVPLDEALRLAGSPALRDAATLAALHLAARRVVPSQDANLSTGARSRAEHPIQLSRGPKMPPVAPAPPPPAEGHEPAPVTLPPEALINMEVSDLSFQERVLSLAEDARNPLLERVRFLSILGSNLDEFFMTRVAGFHQQVASGSTKRTLDGLTPEEQLNVMAIRIRQIYGRAYDFLWSHLVPDLASQGVHLLSWRDLEEGDREYLIDNYTSQLETVLTPLAADPSHPFPHIRNLRPAVGVIVRVPETSAEHFAAIELPGDLPRFVPLPGGRRFIPLEEIIVATLPELYRGLDVVAAHTFRVTRSANFTIVEEEISDLLQAVEEKVHQRPLGPVVRLEVEESMSQDMRDLLLRELQFEARERVSTLREEDVYPVNRLVDLFGLREIASLPLEDLHYPPVQRGSPLDPERRVWPVLRERDVLVHFPYDSFEATVERLLSDAAKDDKVISIKVTLYRTNQSSRVVKLLRKARRKGKEVVALVELKASFDEKRNIEWARTLESSGIHVMYGPPHLKVHAKIALVVRREEDGVRRYLYVGTGNLNAATAASYTDLGLLTTSPELGEEVNDVFNSLTGYSIRTDYQHLLVAPWNMRTRFLELIGREVEHARAGREGRLTVKINGLTDPEIIEALYRASQAGVQIDLIVRGLCALRPGVPGLSENIRVISILGRFLEHARIYRFHNAGSPEYFIGSADWRPRNLSRRVEVVAPVRDPQLRARLDEVLASNLGNLDAWELQPDGNYQCRAATPTEPSR